MRFKGLSLSCNGIYGFEAVVAFAVDGEVIGLVGHAVEATYQFPVLEYLAILVGIELEDRCGLVLLVWYGYEKFLLNQSIDVSPKEGKAELGSLLEA